MISLFYSEIKNKITLIDGISIIFIVLFHELGGINRPDAIFLLRYLATFGLVLFTFSSGLKMGVNHSAEINDKSFISRYFVKRFTRLYKAYRPSFNQLNKKEPGETPDPFNSAIAI